MAYGHSVKRVWWLLFGLISAPASAGELSCLRGLGVTAGAFYTVGSWEHVDDDPWRATGSPMVTMACGWKWTMPEVWVGADAQPWFAFVNDRGEVRRQFASGSVGVAMNSGALRAGVYGTGMFATVGGGALVDVLPFAFERGRGGFELRAAAYARPNPAWQTSLLYVFRPARVP